MSLAQEGRTFGFFFKDANKENYPVYLDYAIRLARPGAVIVGDNCFLHRKCNNYTGVTCSFSLCFLQMSYNSLDMIGFIS
jgi:hypothetical protein